MNLAKQTILITGATSAISLHLAGRLHQLGNQLIACGRSQQLLDQLAVEHLGMATHLGDITEQTQRRKLADWATAQHPALNMVINNAGIMQPFDLNHPVD